MKLYNAVIFGEKIYMLIESNGILYTKRGGLIVIING